MKYHMRRMDRAISDESVLKRVLKTTEYVTIALCKDNEPYLVSLSHGYDEEKHCLYFHCADEGRKIDYLNANNSVWGQALIDKGYKEGECSHAFASVMFSGKVIFVNDLGEKWRALTIMAQQLDSNPERLIEDWTQDSVEKVAIGRIDLEYWSGKKTAEV